MSSSLPFGTPPFEGRIARRYEEARATPAPDGSAQGYDCLVTTAAETLLEQALTLPVQERALLASGLLASLDSEALDEAEVERLWSAETNRREKQMDSGEAEGVTWEHLLQRIDERRS